MVVLPEISKSRHCLIFVLLLLFCMIHFPLYLMLFWYLCLGMDNFLFFFFFCHQKTSYLTVTHLFALSSQWHYEIGTCHLRTGLQENIWQIGHITTSTEESKVLAPTSNCYRGLILEWETYSFPWRFRLLPYVISKQFSNTVNEV